MRHLFATLCAIAIAAPAWSQLPPPGAERDKLRDQALKDWETAMTQVKTLEAECVRTTENKVFGDKEVYRGSIRYLKGDAAAGTPRCASIYLQNAVKPNVYEHLILNGATVYDISPVNKAIRVHNVFQPAAGAGVDANELLLGITAAKAVARFNVSLESANDAQQDKHYWILKLEPKAAADKANFSVARIVLTKTTHLPRQINLRQANGNTQTWDLPRVDTAARIGVENFQPPQLPQGWKWDRPPVQP